MIGNKGDSHYAYIKDFNRFMYNQTKHKEKNILYAPFTVL